jgi:hypothetical protein
VDLSVRDQIVAAVLAGRKDLLSRVTTLSILDSEGNFTGYLSGDVLTATVFELYKLYLAPLNDDRCQRLQALQGTGTYGLEDIVLAVTDPLMIRLQDPEVARLLQFCYQLIKRNGIDIPGHMWWTPALADCMVYRWPLVERSVVRANCRCANIIMYELVSSCLNQESLPLVEGDADWFCSLLRGSVWQVLDNRLFLVEDQE